MKTSPDIARGREPPAARARRVFQTPLAVRLFSLFAVIILAAVTAMMAVAAAVIFATNWALGLFMAAVAAFIGALTGYVWRDLAGKWGLRVVLDPDTVTLDLPAGRSLIHRPPAQHLTIPYADIAAIETRFESYSSLGASMMQQAYVLRRKSGELIFLFEDRALATAIASTMFADIAAELAVRAGVEVRELGMVQGRGGLLGVWGTHAPDWAARPLPLARQLRLWRHAASSGSLAILFIILAMMIRAYFGGH